MGAALAFWYIEQNKERKISNTDDMQGSYLGPQYLQKEIEEKLNILGAKFEIFDEENLINKTVEDLSQMSCNWLVSRKNGIWSKSFRSKINYRLMQDLHQCKKH